MRYLIIADIHSNLAALEAVLADAGPVDRIWCLGDVVGYGPCPNECVERLRALPHLCVAGNHDWASIEKLESSDFNPEARQICLWTGRQLSESSRAYLADLPEVLVEGDFTIVHGSPRHPLWEYILRTATAAVNFDYFDTRYCLVGHTHVPVVFLQRDDGCDFWVPEPGDEIVLSDARLIINPGGVGQPRDGDERASYMLLDTERGTLAYRRVAYPIEQTQQLMREAGLPERQIARLAYGW